MMCKGRIVSEGEGWREGGWFTMTDVTEPLVFRRLTKFPGIRGHS